MGRRFAALPEGHTTTTTAAVLPILDARFVLLDAVGSGGMGTVYRAFDRERERIVALKVLHRSERAGPAHPLAEEFSAWTRLRHANIVRAYELARAGSGPLGRGTPYMVLEHFDGLPAHRALAARDAPEALDAVARCVLRALEHVHAAGLVHRDLKPGNVLVGRGAGDALRVKVTDFGLAASLGARREPGRVSGSLAYLAPESILGRPLDGRSDLYGLGILLWLLACGRLPFDAHDPAGILRWHLEGTTPDPRRTAPRTSERMARLILGLTERDPERRFVSASEALDGLGPSRPRGRRLARRLGVGSAELATLRLALDAARLGAWRIWEAPASWRQGAVLAREACLAAQVHGLALHRIAGPDGPAAVSRLVLRLLIERGPEVRSVIVRHGLHRGIPLGFFGGLPVWDRMRAHDDWTPDEPGPRAATARGIAAFLRESFGQRATVLVVEPTALAHPLVAEIVGALRREAEGRGPGGTGGLLLVLPRGPTSSRSSRRSWGTRSTPRCGS